MTEQQIAAIRLAADCITDAARNAGSLGAPSGIVYAAMSAHGMTLNAYQQILSTLMDMGIVRVEQDCIFLA